MKRGISIRYKFLLVTTALLTFCVVTYLAMATNVFRKDKTELVFDLNRSVVNNLAQDLDTVFASANDKMRLAAYFFSSRDEKSLTILRELLSSSQDIVYVGGSERFQDLNRRFFQNQQFAATYALPDDYFEKVLGETKPIPFAKIQSEGEAIWNATLENGPPLIGFAKSVVLEDGNNASHYAVVAFLRADRVIKALQRGRLSEALVATVEGDILAHPKSDALIKGQVPDLKPLLDAASLQPVRASVMEYSSQGQKYLGAYAKTMDQRVLVLSRVSTDAAFSVVNRFLWRSGLVALMVLNLAFIAAIWFARSLTRPLEALTTGMGRVAEGELSTQIKIESRDEIAELAMSFNGMIRELKTSREALEEINRDLEKKVRDRTLQLEKQNQAVKSAQEALLRTTRLAAVGEIAGRAAHEVLNPLTTILARLERLQMRTGQERMADVEWLKDLVKSWKDEFSSGGFNQMVKSWQGPSQVQKGATLWDEDLTNLEQAQKSLRQELAQVRDDAEFLHKEAQRIGRIVQAMRGLSVVEAVKEERDLNELTEEAANIMRDLASQQQIEISFSRAPDSAIATVNYDEFLQALTNLLRNSIQAIAERKRKDTNLAGRIELQLKAHGDKWQLRVSDNGVGIRPEDQSKLFENQFSTKSSAEGTGLGLNISRRFIRAAGGDIVLEKAASFDGACFLVELPRSVSDKRGVA